MIKEILPEKLKVSFDGVKLSCKTTEELKPLEGIIGQDRAVKALKFGLNIKSEGFNIYVSGQTGTGRTSGVKEFVEQIAKTKPVPKDWVYVNNFSNSYEPNAIKLPAGMGKVFQKDIDNFVDTIREQLPKAFESKDYNDKKNAIIESIKNEKNKLLNSLNKRARDAGFILKTSKIGVFIVPVVDGKILKDQDFMKLSEEKKNEIRKKREKINEDLKKTMRPVRELDRKAAREIDKLNQNVALYTIKKFIDEIKEKYSNIEEISKFIEEVKKDILNNLGIFISKETPKIGGSNATQMAFPWMKELPFRKYKVNLIVDNSKLKGAPVIMEQNPTYQNLFGRVEKEAQFGVLTTDFTMIRTGSVHKANNGFLVIPVKELLKNIFSWDSLKMALLNKEIVIEEAGEKLGFITTKGLKPEPIPLDMKVILIGNPIYYRLLYKFDEDFKKLFKVKADFDIVMDRSEENLKKYAAFVCTICEKDKHKHLENTAVAKIIEYGSRLANDQKKVSTKFSDISDLISEANFYAIQENSRYINVDHISKAIEEKIYRSNLIAEKLREYIADGTLLIDVDGKKVGQANGLSVVELGDYSFGRPSRVTASIGMGKKGIIDIERETKLGGPIHTKGVLILGGYIAKVFSKDKPLNLSARIVFEQSYSEVEGDSASSAELYALLSALSGIPIKQNLAVTGSVNQNGEVQTIGGVNEKIEGFYEICKIKGLTKDQGVLIPYNNLKNLMLKDDVIEAVKEKKFHIYAVKTIDEGIELLTGMKAGRRDKDGNFEKDSINHLVDLEIRKFSEKYRQFLEPEP